MVTSSNLIFRIDDFTPRGKFLNFGSLCIKFSEKTSLQSAPPGSALEFSLRSFEVMKKPEGCLALIMALSYTRQGWSSAEMSFKLLEQIMHQARAHGFQGKWKRIGEILSKRDLFTLGIVGVLEPIIKEMSEDDFYGNFLPKVYTIVEKNLKLISMIKHSRELSKRERFRGIHRKIRRRGYRDKGSLNPNPIASEIKKDAWLEEIEINRQKELDRFRIKDPITYKRYWYRSQFGGG